MGQIKDQTIRGTVFSYLGVLLGFAISALLLPALFSTGEIGLINLLIAYSALFAQFASLGFGNATARLFSWFRDENTKHHGFTGLLLLVAAVGFSLSMIAFVLFRHRIAEPEGESSSLMREYLVFLVPLIFFNLLYLLLDVYFKMLYRTVIGTFLKEFLLRVFILASILLYFIGLLDFKGFITAYVIANCLPAIILFAVLLYEGGISWKPDWRFIDRNLVRSLFSMSFFGVTVGLSNVLVLSVDRIMVEKMIDIKAVGVYSITFFFGTLVVIPSRSLRKIAGTLLADAWKRNDKAQIEDIYAKSIVNQLVIGTLIFVGLWSNIHNVFELLPPAYAPGKWVIFFVALSGLIEMSSGVSEILVQTSSYYRFSAVLNGLFLLFIITFNFLFINAFGLVGAAIANALSYLLANVIRYAFIYKRMQIRPFAFSNVMIVVTGIAVFFVFQLLPALKPYPIDILVRSSLITLVFLVLIYLQKLSVDMNSTFKVLFDKYLKKYF